MFMTYPDADLCSDLRSMLHDERDWLANLANAAALIEAHVPDLNWCGFYLWRSGMLILGPFQGRGACVRIPAGRGVCGAAVLRRAPVLVPDVHAFPGHIACDARSASELVVPVMLGGRLLGVLDLDSPILGRFTQSDVTTMCEVARLLAEGCDWPSDIGESVRLATSFPRNDPSP